MRTWGGASLPLPVTIASLACRTIIFQETQRTFQTHTMPISKARNLNNRLFSVLLFACRSFAHQADRIPAMVQTHGKQPKTWSAFLIILGIALNRDTSSVDIPVVMRQSSCSRSVH